MEERGNADLLASAPALVRLAVTAYLRTLGWSVNAIAKLLLSGEAVEALSRETRDQVKRLLGVAELEERMERVPEVPGPNGRGADSIAVLKERGAELLARSADPDDEEPVHPAYERILTSLAPDEARILRLMAVEGARAAVDIRTWRPLDVGSELVSQGLTMIGQEAGCRYLERVPAYLDNLHRLGLIWFSRETLRDVHRYQVLEAQPDVLAALNTVRYPKLVRRSIHLTPFGEDFCRVCLKLGAGVSLERLPEHSSPLETDKVASPPAE